MSITCDLGAIFSNQSMLGAIFDCILKEFAQIFRNVANVSTDFAQISTNFAKIFRDFSRYFTKSKLLRMRLQPHLLHQRQGDIEF